MNAKWKRNALVATLVVLVCAAAGVNWKYGGGASLPDPSPSGTAVSAPKILGEATLVSGTDEGAEAVVDEDVIYGGPDYFAAARLTRQQARDSAISLLQDAADQKDADQTVANEASEGIQTLAAYTLKEARIENLVTAKGYQDCVAFVGDDSVSVVVSNGMGELSGEDVAKITDIAVSETGLPVSGIKIMAAG